MQIRPLIKRIADGDTHAFAEIVVYYQGPLFTFLGRMGLAQNVAEEIAQEAFLRAWRHLDDYRAEIADFSTWIFTIARNVALNELAKPMNKWETPATNQLLETPCDIKQPHETVADDQSKVRLQAALQQLPPEDRSVLALAYIKDLNMAAIADIEGCTEGALKTRLHRIKQTLRELLEISDE